MSDGPRRARTGRPPLVTDGGVTDGGPTDRGPRIAVVATVALGVVALYAVLGGPLPLVVEGGPSLDAVPSEADAVVYADAWTFAGSSSQEIVDGLLAATNRSLPGYTGPVSLQSAAERLQGTRLGPDQLRSVTAFGAYGPAGRTTDYRGVVLRTGWNVEPLLSAFGDSAGNYDRRTYEGTTVYVHEDPRAEFAWVGRLGSDEYVLGGEAAVTDAIDAHEGRDAGIDDTLRTRFLATGRGPVRFAASMPDSIPGGAIAPASVTDAVGAIETVAGVYRPLNDGAAVDLSITANDVAALERVEPAVVDGIEFAKRNVPERTASLLEAATITRSDATLTVSLSGPTGAFVDGYGAVLETGLVGLLLGQPVGQPALHLVPAGSDVVGYADAAVVVDPTTLGFADAVAGEDVFGVDLATALERVRESSTLEVTALRSVTLFAGGGSGGAVVEADWSPAAIERTLAAGNVTYRRRSVGGTPVFELTALGAAARIAVLEEGHLAVGSPSTVGAVIGVANGTRPALGDPLRPAFERLPRGYATVVGHVPEGLGNGGGTLGQVFSGVEVLGGSYDTTGSRVSLRIDATFETDSAARDAGTALEVGRRLALSGVDNASAVALLEGTTFSRDRRVVTGTVVADPETVVGTARWLVAGNASLPSIPSLALEPPSIRVPGAAGVDRHRFVTGADKGDVITP